MWYFVCGNPDTQCLKEETFCVTSHEGSVVSPCATTPELSLVQPCNNLNFIPSSASLISSHADHPRRKRSPKNMLVSKPSQNVSSSKEQSHAESISNEYYVNQCVIQEYKDKTSKWEYTAYDKNCQSTLCYDGNHQCVHV